MRGLRVSTGAIFELCPTSSNFAYMSDSLISAEAAWAMIFFIVVVLVVLIFCCAVPFYRALEKRYHHWDDIEHDPRYTRDT